jgi:hypothetical protein
MGRAVGLHPWAYSHPAGAKMEQSGPSAAIGALWRNPLGLARLHHPALSLPCSSALRLAPMHHARRR